MGDLVSLSLYRARRQRRTRIKFGVRRLDAPARCVTCGRYMFPASTAWVWFARDGRMEAACATEGGDCFPVALGQWMEASRG